MKKNTLLYSKIVTSVIFSLVLSACKSEGAALTLTIAIDGNVGGTVVSNDGNIICPGACSYDYITGTRVELEASPYDGYIFSHFEDPETECTNANSSETPSCQGNLNQSKTIVVVFEEDIDTCSALAK